MEPLREESEGTPVIFVSAKTSAEDEIKGLRLGAVDFIRKPIHKEVLHLRVRHVLEMHKLKNSRSSRTVSSSPE
jgi:putative two-component system response regulator